jgi:hypothetical protein
MSTQASNCVKWLRENYLDRELAVDFARQGLERCASKLVGASIPAGKVGFSIQHICT